MGIIASILAGDHAWLRYLIFGSGVVVYGAGAWSTFQRNHKGLRMMVRYQLIFSAVLIGLLPFLWLLVRSMCDDASASIAAECALAHNASVCLEGVTGLFQAGDDSSHPCLWAEGACTLPESFECEGMMDGIEYVAMGLVVSLLMYTAWISNSYALEVENGMGAKIAGGTDEETGGD